MPTNKLTPHPGQHDRAFTLIELLVVISIIALLVGILLPALGAARRSAMTAVCMSNVRQMCIAQLSYAESNRQLFAAGRRLETPFRQVSWQAATYQFLTGDALDDKYFLTTAQPEFLIDTAYECPQAKMDEVSPDIYQLSYTMNVNTLGMPYVPNVIGAGTQSKLVNENKFTERIYSAAETLLIADGDDPVVTWDTAGDKDGISVFGQGDPFDSASMGDTNRHNGNVNNGRMDGSVTSDNWPDDDVDIPIPTEVITNRRGPTVPPSQFSKTIKLYWYGRLNDITDIPPKSTLR